MAGSKLTIMEYINMIKDYINNEIDAERQSIKEMEMLKYKRGAQPFQTASIREKKNKIRKLKLILPYIKEVEKMHHDLNILEVAFVRMSIDMAYLQPKDGQIKGPQVIRDFYINKAKEDLLKLAKEEDDDE